MGYLKIEGGVLKGNFIKFHDVHGLRPLTSMIRKAFFDIVDVSGCSILDIFAGSGIFGFEALSRGASQVVFVERSKILCEDIKLNISRLGLREKCRVICEDACRFVLDLKRKKNEKFDVVFLDPPFDFELGEELISAAKDISGWLVAIRRRKSGKSNYEENFLSSFFKDFRSVKKLYSDSVLYMFFSSSS